MLQSIHGRYLTLQVILLFLVATHTAEALVVVVSQVVLTLYHLTMMLVQLLMTEAVHILV